MTQYLLSCQCGESIAVRIQQAGESVRCHRCGHELTIPALRNLRKLPSVEVQDVPSVKGWAPMQGWLFALGVPIIIVSIGVISYCQIERRKLNIEKPSMADLTKPHRDLSQIGLLDAWDIWTKIENAPLDRRGTPMYLVHRERDALLKKIMLGSGGCGLAGLISVVIALASGRSSRRQ